MQFWHEDVAKRLRSSTVSAMLVVAATDLELGSVEGVETLCCGIGPVEAALTTLRALSERAPKCVLHIGIAGARKLEPPTLVVGSEAVYCDLVDESSRLPRHDRLSPDPDLLAAARIALPDAQLLPIATAGRIGAGGCCDVEAMEGFGVLRAAALMGVPAIELRAVSNAVGDSDRRRWRIHEALELLGPAVAALLEELDA